jgi:hypothetical protein
MHGLVKVMESEMTTFFDAYQGMVDERATQAEDGAGAKSADEAKEVALNKLVGMDKEMRKIVEGAFEGLLQDLEAHKPAASGMAAFSRGEAAKQFKAFDRYALDPPMPELTTPHCLTFLPASSKQVSPGRRRRRYSSTKNPSAVRRPTTSR